MDLEPPDNGNSLLDNLTIKESYNNIISHIKALPSSLSDVLYLSVVFGNSTKEISNLLGISNDAVRQRLSRGKALIKRMLVGEGVENAER